MHSSTLKRRLVPYLQELARYGSKRIFPARHLSFDGGTELRMDLRPIDPSSNLLNKEVHRNPVNKCNTRFIHAIFGLPRKHKAFESILLARQPYTRSLLNKRRGVTNELQYRWCWYDDRDLRYGIKSEGATNTF
jgi:hypothetical protein